MIVKKIKLAANAPASIEKIQKSHGTSVASNIVGNAKRPHPVFPDGGVSVTP